MKKVLLLIFACLALTAQAQEEESAKNDSSATTVPQLKIGFVSYTKALQAMPDYALTQKRLAELRTQYDKELKRVEDEFNRKYEEFLDGQKEFPKTILMKRQTELKELMERNVAFKANSLRELADAEVAAMKPLKEQLNGVLAEVAKKHGFVMILNTDADACPYIDPTMGVDVLPMVMEEMKK